MIVASNITGPTIDLGYAKYRGIHNATLSINTFYGLRFASPPTGPLRWNAPEPIENSQAHPTDIIDATTSGPGCIQGYPYWTNPNAGIPTGSEDCLFVNVLVPANATAESKLPVLVGIPGGGYTLGDATQFPGEVIMRHSSNSFIFVSTQYRLGAYGFLGSQEFVRGGGIANAGLLDQRLALEWIQNHISAFGGDPAKVTLIGGSAGGGSITDQMILRGGVENPPFRAAIVNFPWWQQFLKEGQLSKQFHHLLMESGCDDVDCLRAVSEGDLKAATQATYKKAYAAGDYGYGNFYYGPYVDGALIRDLPSREFKKGHFTKIPVLVTREKYEGFTFSNQSITTSLEESLDLKVQFPIADDDFVEKVFNMYPRNAFNSSFWHRQTWFGDFSINCPTHYIASTLSTAGLNVWKEVFNAGSGLHGGTQPFFTDDPEAAGVNVTLAIIMKDRIVSFAVHNDPNAQSWSGAPSPFWPTYEVESNVMETNSSEISVVSDALYDKSERCKFFWGSGDIVQN
ncbi:alpha/beta-hydrolase [Melanomma pulvis-pyrius CBS 109.77]|uniref:Carboxylic ester hydrolase n=1 Tax=Melanomma pulvis-pyrius CBS 109.77 TaxID=1314802 RepID=A0A6A6XCZ0_9PLEO|nr:alpha/beta-hydrolase [Melanomma pulvis-pyrius CBS 109.77]